MLGNVRAQAISHLDFETQRRSYASFGYAIDPASIGKNKIKYTGDTDKIKDFGAPDALGLLPERSKAEVKSMKREARGDYKDLDNFKGPWAKFEMEVELDDPTLDEPSSELEETEGEKPKKRRFENGLTGDERTIFHGIPHRLLLFYESLFCLGSKQSDYQGRTYMHVPQDQGIRLDRDPEDHDTFLPKKVIHTWKGHQGGVNAIQFFPRSGHLLLSASNDSTVKLWDVYHERQCLRTMLGHDKAVRGIDFTNDGKHFLTCSWDSYIKLWDTETGQCVKAFTRGVESTLR